MPVALWSDFDAPAGRAAAKRSKDCPQTRRLLAVAAIYDGATRTQAAAMGNVTLQIVRDGVVKFNGSGPDGLVDRKAPGQPSRLNDTHRSALAAIIERESIPAIHGVVPWRITDVGESSQASRRAVPFRRSFSTACKLSLCRLIS